MNLMINLNAEQALRKALICAGIEKEELACLLQEHEEGLYHFQVRSCWMEYEFYVEAASGEVLGMQTAPLSYREVLDLCENAGPALSAVA